MCFTIRKEELVECLKQAANYEYQETSIETLLLVVHSLKESCQSKDVSHSTIKKAVQSPVIWTDKRVAYAVLKNGADTRRTQA